MANFRSESVTAKIKGAVVGAELTKKFNWDWSRCFNDRWARKDGTFGRRVKWQYCIRATLTAREIEALQRHIEKALSDRKVTVEIDNYDPDGPFGTIRVSIL